MGFLTQFGEEAMEDGMDMAATSSAETVAAVAMTVIITAVIVSVILYLVCAFFLSMVFKKAGVPAWKAWVPGLNIWVFFELGDQKPLLALLFLGGIIPLVGFVPVIAGLVFAFMAAHHIGRKFGKETWFVVLAIFLFPVWVIWLALDKSAAWKGATAAQPMPTPGEQAVAAAPALAPVAPEVAPDVAPATDTTWQQSPVPTPEAPVETPTPEASFESPISNEVVSPAPAPVTSSTPPETPWQPQPTTEVPAIPVAAAPQPFQPAPPQTPPPFPQSTQPVVTPIPPQTPTLPPTPPPSV